MSCTESKAQRMRPLTRLHRRARLWWILLILAGLGLLAAGTTSAISEGSAAGAEGRSANSLIPFVIMGAGGAGCCLAGSVGVVLSGRVSAT